MIIDLKYHIASLAAVFLALAIGVVTGTVMLGNDTLVWQQERMTDSLESEISTLKDYNQQLRGKMQELDKQALMNIRFEQGVLPALIEDRLIGVKVIVIDTCSRGTGLEVGQLLAQAGARVEKVVELQPAYGGSSGVPAALTAVVTHPTEKQSARKWEEISRRLAGELLAGTSQVLPVLQQNHLAQVSLEKSNPNDVDEAKVDTVIILGGSKRKELPRRQFEYIDQPMIKFFKEQGVRVIGAEAVDTAVSYIPYFNRFNLTTVDNVDTVAGKLSLVLAVEGSQGTFGVKGTAKKYLPLE